MIIIKKLYVLDSRKYLVEKYDLKKGRWEYAGETEGTSYNVGKLLEGHEYKFRILAENINGFSEPLETDKTVLAKDPFVVSEAPRNLECVDRDKTFITVKWAPPIDDGGTPITGYLLQKKEPKGTRWTNVIKEAIPETEYKDENVKEGKSYEYRVFSVNKAGISDPSKPSAAFFAKSAKGIHVYELVHVYIHV